MNKKWEQYVKRIYNRFPDIDNLHIRNAFEAFQWITNNEDYETIQGMVSANVLTKEKIIQMSESQYSYDYTDENMESIAFVLSSGSKKILFLADSNIEVCRKNLEQIYGDRISDYPYKSNNVNTGNVNEITASWCPGSIIGYNFSGKMFNLDILNKAGISMSAVEEGALIGDREWEKEQSGRPDFYCVYGNIEESRIQKNPEHKVVVCIEYQCNTIEKRLIVDIDNHAVYFI